jgi:hypothetical protein
MAAKKKKRAKKAKFGEKAEFVRSMPATASAREIVEAAKKKGISLSDAYVYNLRSLAGITKKRGGKRAARKGGRRGGGRRAAPAGGNLESQLRKSVAELGLVKAREVFESVEAAFGR